MYLLIRDADKRQNLLRSSDGVPILTEPVPTLHFSKDVAHSFFATSSAQGVVLRRTADVASLWSLSGDYKKVTFSRDEPPSRIILHRADGPFEVRATSDGSLIAQLTGGEGIVTYPQYFLVRYRDDADELRRLSDGQRVTMLEGSVKKLEFPDEAYFIVHRNDGAQELRRSADGALIDHPLKRNIRRGEFFGPQSRYEALWLMSGEAEVLRTSNGTVINRLGGSAGAVTDLQQFSGNDTDYLLVGYRGAPSDLHRLSDGLLIATLSDEATNVKLLSSLTPPAFIVHYRTGSAELWQGSRSARRVAELGLNIRQFSAEPTRQRLSFAQNDGRAFLVDLDWLRQAAAIDPTDPDLVRNVCQALAPHLADAALEGHLKPHRACQ
jgi:hypothetical protein